jgi:hypothetical protein
MGIEVETATRKVMREIIEKGIKVFAGREHPCTGEELHYQQESPVCWGFWGMDKLL